MQIKMISSTIFGKVVIELSSVKHVREINTFCVLLPVEVTSLKNGRSIEIPDEYMKSELNTACDPVEWFSLFQDSKYAMRVIVSIIGLYFGYHSQEEKEWYDNFN